jgi:hypothetical protein
MRTLLVLTAFCCGLALLQPATQPASAQEKQAPVKWEYAELVYRGAAGRPAGIGGDGKPVEATASTLSIRWSSGGGEISVKGWDELAEKLKTPFKKEGANPKIQMLNALGAEGWELVSSHVGTTASTTLMFKRRVP